MAGNRMGRMAAAALLAAAACSAQAGSAKEEAEGGALADGLTTAVGLAAGAAELNPLGPVLGIGVKYAVLEYAKTLPDEEKPAAYAAAASIWQGAAANNLCVAASLLSGGSFAPMCIALGVAWGAKTWNDSAAEREFWQACTSARQAAGDMSLPCISVIDSPQAAAPRSELLVQVRDESRY